MSERIRDFALVIGHTWRCYECRESLLADSVRTCRGYKLSEAERMMASLLTDESFNTVMNLAVETGFTTQELETAIDHPHARLRHLGIYKSGNSYIQRGSE